MSESVEQAALRRATDSEVLGRARREATAILDETGFVYVPGGTRNAAERFTRDRFVNLLAVAWLQGHICGTHETLARSEVAFENLREALS